MANEKRLDLINKWDVVNKLIQLENNYQFYKEQWDADVLYRRICELEIGIGKTPTVDAIVPPVKIGQVLWCNIPHSEFPLECRVYCICREERNGLVLDYFRCAVKGWFGKAFSFEDVGKTVFITEAEALAKMDGGNEDGC